MGSMRWIIWEWCKREGKIGGLKRPPYDVEIYFYVVQAVSTWAGTGPARTKPRFVFMQCKWKRKMGLQITPVQGDARALPENRWIFNVRYIKLNGSRGKRLPKVDYVVKLSQFSQTCSSALFLLPLL